MKKLRSMPKNLTDPAVQMALAIHDTTGLYSLSYDRVASDAAEAKEDRARARAMKTGIEYYSIVDYKKFYRMDLMTAAKVVAGDLAYPIYLLLSYSWNDAGMWAEEIIGPGGLFVVERRALGSEFSIYKGDAKTGPTAAFHPEHWLVFSSQVRAWEFANKMTLPGDDAVPMRLDADLKTVTRIPKAECLHARWHASMKTCVSCGAVVR